MYQAPSYGHVRCTRQINDELIRIRVIVTSDGRGQLNVRKVSIRERLTLLEQIRIIGIARAHIKSVFCRTFMNIPYSYRISVGCPRFSDRIIDVLDRSTLIIVRA